MQNFKQKLKDMEEYLDSIGLQGRLREAFLRAYLAYLKSRYGG
jgi:hypothetical protein